MPQAVPTLKLIVVDPTDPHVFRKLRHDLEREASAGELRSVFGNAYVVNTALEPAELRDLIVSDLDERDSLLVVEFERWSGYGREVDAVWLMRRGH